MMEKLSELVDRYEVACYCGEVDVKSKRDGHLVMYSDYAVLEHSLKDANACIEAARQEITDLEQRAEESSYMGGGARYWHDEYCAQQQRLVAKIVGLEAKLAELVPEGWRLVPVEPTKEMWDAYDAAERDIECEWSAMLAAAPNPSE